MLRIPFQFCNRGYIILWVFFSNISCFLRTQSYKILNYCREMTYCLKWISQIFFTAPTFTENLAIGRPCISFYLLTWAETSSELFWSPVVCRPSVRLYTFNIFNFFSRTTGPISAKLGTNHIWVEWIQVCSNEGPRPSTIGGNSKILNFFLKYF